MADQGIGARGALVAEAGNMLREGREPAGVFAELAVRTGDGPSAVTAVCLALGLPPSEVEARLDGEAGEFVRIFSAGEEDVCGEVLETSGVFDVPRTLDERGTETRRLLGVAVAAAGPLGSGYAFRLSRRFVRGELTGAFLLLVRVGPRVGSSRAAAFWTALSVAGAHLLSGPGEEDPEVERALGECRRRLAGHPDAADRP
ncbi:hypothetical protein OHB07_05825 [Streptomyces sp. NBC_00111]|uniref:hypothetical protein n=1 Tax=Streptomyces sp. NBC_00111 TaxID=2975655 RepID=UPI003255548A